MYKKDIEAAKASGKIREAANLQRDLERFETRLVDERKAMEVAQTQQSNYLRALNSVSTKNALLSGVSFEQTAKAVNVQSLASASSEKKFTNIVDAKNMTQEEARAAYGAKEAGRAVDQMATLSRDTSALQAVGATTQQASAYAAARSARIEARADWDAAMASGNKAAAQAAEDAFMAAREAETVAGRAAAAAAATASVSAAAASAAAQEVTTEVAKAAQEAAQAAQEVTTEVAQAAQDATRDAQQAALDALWK